MQPIDIQQTCLDISHARLSSYKNFFGCDSVEDVYGIYCWNEAISGNLFRLISITEIVMRNRFHSALSQHAFNQQSIGSYTANDWYLYISLGFKSSEKIYNIRHKRIGKGKFVLKNPEPTSNDVVSQLTFGFWNKLLNSSLPWGNLIPEIVPGHRHKTSSHWSKQNNQDKLYARIETVNDLRNRIAHFEPIWKQKDLKEERRQRQNKPKLSVVMPAPKNSLEALERLILLHDRTVELLHWFSPSRAKDYQTSYVKSHFDWLCSKEGLDSYLNYHSNITLPSSIFKRELNKLTREKTMVNITKNNKVKGVFYSR